MIVRPWHLGDSKKVNIQKSQQYVADLGMLDVDITGLSEAGLAWSATVGEQVIACWGAMPQWQNRAVVWALIGQRAGPWFPAIHKNAERFLNEVPFRRMEAHVDIGFDQGVRWMKMLGFELEVYRRAFRPDGADMLEFVRIK